MSSGASATTTRPPGLLSLLRRLVLAGVLGGLLAGAVQAALAFALLTPLILDAERIEAQHAPVIVPDRAETLDSASSDAAPPAPAEWMPATGQPTWQDRMRRHGQSAGVYLLIGVGLGVLLSSGFTLLSRPPSLAQGLLWGVAGYAAVHLAPALGLPPELPGMTGALLEVRQTWWLIAVGATAAGLGLICLPVPLRIPLGWLRLLGLAALLLPHLGGVPLPTGEASLVPAHLAAAFAARSLVLAGVFWALLGLGCAALFRHLSPSAPLPRA